MTGGEAGSVQHASTVRASTNHEPAGRQLKIKSGDDKCIISIKDKSKGNQWLPTESFRIKSLYSGFWGRDCCY